MVAPIIGTPDSSKTLPVIFFVCAWASMASMAKNNRKKMNTFFI
jgi:hypothetical protein